jgi:hypothetical protein
VRARLPELGSLRCGFEGASPKFNTEPLLEFKARTSTAKALGNDDADLEIGIAGLRLQPLQDCLPKFLSQPIATGLKFHSITCIEKERPKRRLTDGRAPEFCNA